MKVCQEILTYLKKNGIKDIYGIPSGTISPIVDATNDIDINYIITKNESAASYSATKYAKVTQKLGVVLISGSVGVANAMNGIAEAMETGAPILIIGGHVNTWQQGKGALQELESEKLLSGVVKYTKKITNEKEVMKELKKAIEIALEYPRGPVHIGLPLNIQKEEYTGEDIQSVTVKELSIDYEGLDKAVNLINECNNGLIIVGGGCRGLGDSIKRLEDKLNWRLVTTTSAKGVIEDDYRLNMGNFGYPGTDIANTYVKEAHFDCILALGTQLGEVATQNYTQDLTKGKLIHIDVNEKVFNRSYKEDLSIKADLNYAIDYLAKYIFVKDLNNDIKKSRNMPTNYCSENGVSLRVLYENITQILPADTFYVQDMGDSMNFAFKYLNLPKEADFEGNMNYACMGSSIGAIGISRINPERQVAVFIGDGSFFMNGMAELLTVKKYNMNIIYFVINNAGLDFVYKGHLALFGRTIESFRDENINISEIAKSMNIHAIRITNNNEINNIKEFIKDKTGPIVVDVVVDISEPIPTNRFKNLK